MEPTSSPRSAGTDRSLRRRRVARAIEDFCAGRDREASFRLVYETYHRALLGFFRRRGVPAEETLDLTQETFLGIYKGLEGYRHSDRFEGWIFRIAETCWLKKLRASATAKRSAVETSLDALGRGEGTAEQQLHRALAGERRERVRAAVRNLPGQMRRCLTLRLQQELSYREIAVVLRLSPETVKVHLSRARQRLKQELGSLDLDGPEDP
ncbi:MAG: sigma-70 family RNA polymerase sigma factor [Acidobacteriota bacterium]